MLCDDVWHEIADYLPLNELLCLKSTNKELYQVLNEDLVKALHDHNDIITKIKNALIESGKFYYNFVNVIEHERNMGIGNGCTTVSLLKICRKCNEFLSLFIKFCNENKKDNYVTAILSSYNNSIDKTFTWRPFEEAVVALPYIYCENYCIYVSLKFQRKCHIIDNNLEKLTFLCIKNNISCSYGDYDQTMFKLPDMNKMKSMYFSEPLYQIKLISVKNINIFYP